MGKTVVTETVIKTVEREADGAKYRYLWSEPHYHQPFGAGGESEHHAQQLHFTATCRRHGAASERFVARTAYAANGTETDKQVYSQKSKEEQP